MTPASATVAAGASFESLERLLLESPYQAYLYAYPHKTAYRPLSPAVRLDELWAKERRDALFLYMHIPFCEMRCGFCNLFTEARPEPDIVTRYLDQLERQARRVRAALDTAPSASGAARFLRVAIGGGTPTILDERGLERVLSIARDVMGASLGAIPMSVETSPETARPERLRLLVDGGADRISIGVQSFFEDEVRAVNRPQRTADVHAALDAIRAAGVPNLNIDLMYGLPGQTPARWMASLEQALRWQPEELYLYPLYVRPLTTLGKRRDAGRDWDDERIALYRIARACLLSTGYQQVSMRMFRRVAPGTAPAAAPAPVYRCQEDGMLGLGCGARSYSSELHYASEYAVGARGVEQIIRRWLERDERELDVADYGIRLDEDEQRRRWLILSLLADEGADAEAYKGRFGAARDLHTDFPQLAELVRLGLAERTDRTLRLTPAGLERSDTIGPWLHSRQINALMQAYDLR